MVYFNDTRNILMKGNNHFSFQDREEPELFRDMFPYTEIPKCVFDGRVPPMDPPDEIWITDTTFRDGQQSRSPYTPDQIVELYKLLNKLGGPKGMIRQTEFFLYSERDKEALRRCQDLGLPFPEITGWIRASKSDFALAKDMGLKECGILVSSSDYHIYNKLKKTRRQAMDDYLGIIKDALSVGIRARCHFEDITRADFYGYVIPFAAEITKLSQESGVPIKIRICDTLGFGVPYPGASLPRSIPAILYAFRNYAGFESSQLEWHGHNDFHKSVVNSTTAWLYGAASVNAALLGIGERTGNTPLEAMVIEYAQIRGTLDGMDTRVIPEIAEYYQKELGYTIPPKTPFIGEEFNITQAGIHADGLLKDEEIYCIFDTETLLGSPPGVSITQTSGAAGIAMWLSKNVLYGERVEKGDLRVATLKAWVDEQYSLGRVTTIGSDELLDAAKGFGICP